MIDIREYEIVLQKLEGQYFIKDLTAVPDLTSWARENNQDLSEPYNPMKLVANTDNPLSMMVQQQIKDEQLNDVIKNLSIRWAVHDTVTDIDRKLNSIKIKLIFCYPKERARTMKNIGGDEQGEDQRVIEEMESLGFFKE
ncbi:MAG: hypothetical protein AMK71_03625 [Nitrospira bacterium SG8_35_4]|nr:MAG: hypothetical protein AMK71_03625 [Nitrospira bacterium SG8_35_4]